METIQLQWHFKARRERVFAAWTRPDLLARWWGPKAEAEVDLRVGGPFRLSMRFDWGALVALGEYREVSPPERLVFTWRWEGEEAAEEGLVTLELREAEGGTDLLLTHQGLSDAQAAENHRQGWTDCVARLVGIAQAIDRE